MKGLATRFVVFVLVLVFDMSSGLSGLVFIRLIHKLFHILRVKRQSHYFPGLRSPVPSSLISLLTRNLKMGAPRCPKLGSLGLLGFLALVGSYFSSHSILVLNTMMISFSLFFLLS